MVARIRDIAGYTGAVLIGQGGFGVVYRASDDDHDRQVAIKVLPGQLSADERRRFDRERRAMGRLGSHPSIVPVYDSGYTEAGEGYIVMELATGGTLGDRVESSGPLPWDDAVRYLIPVTEAVQTAHDNGVMHRDIKPDNILINELGYPKLTDFGIAAVVDNETATTSTTATLAHAAPELLEGSPSTPAIDVYALGSTLHTLVSGLPPFMRAGEEANMAALINRLVNQSPPDLRPLGVPDEVASIVERALAKEPADRQSSAAELATELRSSIGDDSGLMTPSGFSRALRDSGGAGTATGGGVDSGRRSSTGPTRDIRSVGDPVGAGAGGLVSPATGRSDDVVPGTGPTGPGGGRSGSSSNTEEWVRPNRRRAIGGAAAALIGASAAIVLLLAAGVGMRMMPENGSRALAPWPLVDKAPVAGDGGELGDVADVDDGSEDPPDEAAPSVEIECPTEIRIGTRVDCTIVSAGIDSGSWRLPGFFDGSLPLDEVPGRHEIFIEPTASDTVGRSYTMSVTGSAAGGRAVDVEHTFTVVGASIEVSCPAEIALNSTIVCEIRTEDVVEGEWDIPGFGGDVLDTAEGSTAIFIEPTDPGSVGRTYTITATGTGSAGETVTGSGSFEVVDG